MRSVIKTRKFMWKIAIARKKVKEICVDEQGISNYRKFNILMYVDM